MKEIFVEEAVLDDIAKDFDLVETPLSEKAFRAAGVFAVAVIAVIVFRLLFLAAIKNDFYKNRALANAAKITVIQPERGIIADKFGKPLVENEPVYRLSLRLVELIKKEEKEKTLSAVEKELKIKKSEIENLIGKIDLENQDLITLNYDLNDEQIKNLEALNLKSIQINRSFRRKYLEPEIFSHIVGYTGFADEKDLENGGLSLNDAVGKSGLEKYYDGDLRGEKGQFIHYRNAKGEIIDDKFLNDARAGNLVQTTIDAEFQKFFYNQLAKRLEELGSKNGVGVAIDPRNGEVLSLISIPGFDSNNIAKKDIGNPNKPLFNRAVSGMYAPGSTIKPLVALAALNENIIGINDRIFSRGYIEVPNPYYPDSPSRYLDWKPHGWVNLYSAIARSSNVYFYALGGGLPDEEVGLVGNGSKEFKGLGIEKLKSYWQKFGLGEQTGIDLPFEAKGFLPDPNKKKEQNGEPWRLGDTYNVSIGQGDLLATPIEIINYIGAVANGGKIYRPFIAKNFFSEKEELIRENQPRVIKDYSELLPYFREIQKAMVETTSKDYGTAYSLGDLPFKTAAKTGTAQIKGSAKTINAFFVGYAPAESDDNPEIALLILIENAKEGASNTLSVAKEVLKWYYYNRIANNKE